MSEEYESMLWFPYVKRWGNLPQYRDASLCARAIVDAAMIVFMGRGNLPSGPDALRRAIGADEREFARGYVEAQVCIEILEPQWRSELDAAWHRFEASRSNGKKGGRKPKNLQVNPQDNPQVNQPVHPLANPQGDPLDNPQANTLTLTDLAKAKSPIPRRSARDGGDTPEGFDGFWEAFRAKYPRRPGQPWSEGRKAMLKALQRNPGLNLAIVLEGVSGYADLMEATKKTGTDKVAHAATWINQDRWECDYTMMPIDGEYDGPLF